MTTKEKYIFSVQDLTNYAIMKQRLLHFITLTNLLTILAIRVTILMMLATIQMTVLIIMRTFSRILVYNLTILVTIPNHPGD